MAKNYSRMRAEVRKRIPKLIAHRYTVKATKVEKRGALKALAAITELFGPKGEHWTQGNYHFIKDGVESFCLSGALNKIDGQHEALARAAIHIAIEELAPETQDGDIMTRDDRPITDFNDDEKVKWAMVKQVLARAAKILQS